MLNIKLNQALSRYNIFQSPNNHYLQKKIGIVLLFHVKKMMRTGNHLKVNFAFLVKLITKTKPFFIIKIA